MQQFEPNRVACAIVSAGCIIAASICVGVGYLVPALMMAGKNYSQPEQSFASYLSVATSLFTISGVLYLLGVGMAVWASLPARQPAA